MLKLKNQSAKPPEINTKNKITNPATIKKENTFRINLNIIFKIGNK